MEVLLPTDAEVKCAVEMFHSTLNKTIANSLFHMINKVTSNAIIDANSKPLLNTSCPLSVLNSFFVLLILISNTCAEEKVSGYEWQVI